MAGQEALPLFKVEWHAYAAMLTAGVESTERYLQLPAAERTVQPESDPQFLQAEANLAEARRRLSQAVIRAA